MRSSTENRDENWKLKTLERPFNILYKIGTMGPGDAGKELLMGQPIALLLSLNGSRKHALCNAKLNRKAK
jgi:hypothetical protein